MAQNKRPTNRKPATKFAHLRKKMEKGKLHGSVKKIGVRKTGHK
jgi:hypothetical protein